MIDLRGDVIPTQEVNLSNGKEYENILTLRIFLTDRLKHEQMYYTNKTAIFLYFSQLFSQEKKKLSH